MPNHKHSFHQRNQHGNIAERLAEGFMQKHNITYIRFGLNQINKISFKDMCKMPIFLRYAPDYFTITDSHAFLEVKGCADVLRLKLDSIKELKKWEEISPINFFIYSTTYNCFTLIKFKAIRTHLEEGDFEMGRFHDNNKPYWKIPVKLLMKEGKVYGRD